MRQATHRVEINPTTRGSWYDNMVGNQFNVLRHGANRNYWEVADDPVGELRVIHIQDCSVIQDYIRLPENNGTTGPIMSVLETQVGGNHYKDSKIQPVEFIEANNIQFLEACVIKRCCRHAKKNGIEDIEKAIHELKLIAKFRYGKEIA